MTEAAVEPAETVSEPVAGEQAQEGSEKEEPWAETTEAPEPETATAEPVDHAGLLRELAGIIRDIPVNALEVAHVTELKSWLTSHGLGL